MFSTGTWTKFVAVAVAAIMCVSGAQAKDFYKMSTISLPTPFAINTTFAKIIQKYNKGIEIQINATGAAPRHALDAANGKTDLFFSAPSLMFLMSKGWLCLKKSRMPPSSQITSV